MANGNELGSKQNLDAVEEISPLQDFMRFISDMGKEARDAKKESIVGQQEERAAGALDDESRSVIRRMVETIGQAREEGQTSANIRQSLERDVAQGRGGLEGLLGTLRENIEIMQQRYYVGGQEDQLKKDKEPEDVRATWNAVGVNTCEDCLARHGKTRTLEQWKRIGLPGQSATRCRHRCRCTLIPVATALKLYEVGSEDELENAARAPIRERAAAIKKELAREGKDLARSTFLQKVGDFRMETASKTQIATTRPF